MPRTATQNSRLHLLLGNLGWTNRKAELVYSYSSYRTTSSSELTETECAELIRWLDKQTKPTKPLTPTPLPKGRGTYIDDPADKMRKKILSICHDLRWEVPGGKIDWKHLNDWLLKYGYLKKALNNYTVAELPKLVTQFEKIERTTLYPSK